MQRLQGLISVKSLRISNAPLTHKRPQCDISEGTAGIHKPASTVSDLIRPTPHHLQPLLLMVLFRLPRISVGVFETVEMVFKGRVVELNQLLDAVLRFARTLPAEIARISLLECPVHHRKTFIDHRAISENQNRHRCFRRCLKHRRWFVLEFNFPPLDKLTCLQQGPACAHRIGTATKAVEDRPGAHA